MHSVRDARCAAGSTTQAASIRRELTFRRGAGCAECAGKAATVTQTVVLRLVVRKEEQRQRPEDHRPTGGGSSSSSSSSREWRLRLGLISQTLRPRHLVVCPACPTTVTVNNGLRAWLARRRGGRRRRRRRRRQGQPQRGFRRYLQARVGKGKTQHT